MDKRSSSTPSSVAGTGATGAGPGAVTVDTMCDTASIDSQFTDADDVKFLDACIECDDDLLYDVIQDGVTWDEVNERDKSGRVRGL